MSSQTASVFEPLTGEDVGFFCNALASSRGQFANVTKSICEDYRLGPRGPWIVGLVGRSPLSPLALSTWFNCGRSLITAELARLSEAGLINQTRSEEDGRRILLTLTAKGETVHDRLGVELASLLSNRLSGYSHDQIMLCAQMLADFAKQDGD